MVLFRSERMYNTVLKIFRLLHSTDVKYYIVLHNASGIL